MGVFYVQTVHGRERGHSLHHHMVEMRRKSKEGELGLELSPGIVCCSKYTVRYLNMLVHSAYMLVGQSVNIPKSHTCLSGHAAYPVVMRGSKVFELLVESKQGPCLVGSRCALKRSEVCCTSC
jgi:hypothetical protein